MLEPWKVIICQKEECLSEALDEKGKVKEGYHIYPNLDNELLTQFTCPRCGETETWGVTRREVMKTLFKRFSE